ncbi:(2Fe-2S)-binding protein [Sphingomonas koreensis]|nr:(2Fe-2S)-binding protein [Sphingomonas koreensis]
MSVVAMTVNGETVAREIDDATLLVDYLREALGLTGTHVGCDTTQCGCCVVHIDGVSAKSCTVLAASVAGRQIATIEGLAKDGELHPVQQAFREHHGLQCGFCTPGQIMAAVELIDTWDGPPLDEHQVREEMEGNLCRCTGYHNIVKAILAAAAEMRPAA